MYKMFRTALVKTTPNWKPCKWLSALEWINTWWHIPTVEWSAAMRMISHTQQCRWVMLVSRWHWRAHPVGFSLHELLGQADLRI